MRVFFAIEFDDKTRAYIKSVQSMIRENSIKGNFSHEENFHLTLRFIGEVDENQLISLKSALNRAIEQTSPFSINFNKLGFFSREGKKIVWMGIKNEDKCLDKLYKALEDHLVSEGFQREERGYSPHITLSRETILKQGFDEQLKNIKVSSAEIGVSKISLMESVRVDGKLTYRAVYVKSI